MSTPALEMAREYVARKMRVVPVPAGLKRPVLPKWQELRLTETDLPPHFSNGSNIGIILGTPSDGLVDVDLDCIEVESVARFYLPDTKMWGGRDKRPRSHAWYRAVGDAPKTVKFSDPRKKEGEDHATLIELRSTGGQTIVAPSRHPSGDTYIWNGSLDPAAVDGDELVTIVSTIGSAALLARYWNNTARHDAAMALAGMLLRAGWTEADAKTFIEAVATAAGDDEVHDRVRTVADTAQRLAAGVETTGAPTLAELIGEDIVKAVKGWLRLRGTVGLEEHQTELGLADRIVREHGAKMRFVWGWESWIAWDGKRWMKNAEGDVSEMAKATVRPLLSDASKLPDGDARKAAIRFAMIAERDRTMAAALRLARSEPGISIKTEALNQDTGLLNTLTGIVDLRTGTVRPHDPKALLTKLCPTPYDPTATAPEWERFVLRIFDRDFGMIAFIQRLFGYAATGSCREQLLPIFWGKGANGKSTLTTAIEDTLGPDYAAPIAHSLLFAEKKDSHPAAVADLYGKRVAITHELDGGTRLAEGLVKQLTGGDRIKARGMRENFWQFTPTHTIFLATNTKPVIRGTDDGIWRRPKLIPFTVQIPPKEQDTDLGAKLRAEAPGIFAWIVAGARDWYEHGLETPPSVKAATDAYRTSSDVIGEFLAANCIEDPTIKTTAKGLYDCFAAWHKDQIGGETIKQATFGRHLGDRGFIRLSKERPIAWQGIGLASEPLP